jgi:hypothetical protein
MMNCLSHRLALRVVSQIHDVIQAPATNYEQTDHQPHHRDNAEVSTGTRASEGDADPIVQDLFCVDAYQNNSKLA